MVISKELMEYSLKKLLHKRARSFLTILSIFVGIATIFIFISFGLGLYNYINDLAQDTSADKIIIQAKGSGAPGLDDSFALTDDDLDAVKKVGGVYDASGIYFKVADVEKGKEKKYTFLIAYDPDKPMIMDIYNIDIAKGRELRKGDSGKVLLGYNYQFPNKIFERGLDINDKIEVHGKELRIVGFLGSVGNPQDDSQIYIINDYVDELYSDQNNSYGWIIARVDIDNIKGVITNVERELRNSRNVEKGKEDFFVQSFEDMIETYSSALDIIIGFVILIALISVLVSAVNTANTMVTSVLERKKEIGVMKSIGARNSEILKLFLFESGFLGFVAGVIGVFFGWILASIAGNILVGMGWGFLAPYYSWELFVGCILFATITGAISGFVPAYQASKTNIVDALRYE